MKKAESENQKVVPPQSEKEQLLREMVNLREQLIEKAERVTQLVQEEKETDKAAQREEGIRQDFVRATPDDIDREDIDL